MPSKSAKVIRIIQVVTNKGKGTETDPNRVVVEFWSLDGKLLAISDPYATCPGSPVSSLQ